MRILRSGFGALHARPCSRWEGRAKSCNRAGVSAKRQSVSTLGRLVERRCSQERLWLAKYGGQDVGVKVSSHSRSR